MLIGIFSPRLLIIFTGDKDGLKKFIGGRGSIPDPEGFFSKPIDQGEFLKAVKNILA